jgi:NAD(P)-dependent dehydrogenase (short-subunit alcohol dehydrogenase family)
MHGTGHRRIARPGLQMAHALGEAGARVMLSSRKADDLEQAVAELQAAGIDARWIAADCAVEEDLRRLADQTLERMGRIDILVNNAGAVLGRSGARLSGGGLGQGHEPQHPRLFHPEPACRQALDDPQRRRAHHQHGLDLRPGRQPAGHADDCLQHLQGRRRQLHPGAGLRMGQHNINVNAVCPGFFPSKLSAGALKVFGEDTLASHAPLGGWATTKTSRA